MHNYSPTKGRRNTAKTRESEIGKLFTSLKEKIASLNSAGETFLLRLERTLFEAAEDRGPP
jgi:hypothetical protein